MDDSSNMYGPDKQFRDIYAVFGNPVLHSKSPQLYNSLFTRYNTDSFYTRIHARSGRAVCEIIRMLGLSGANVTTPFKEDVIPFMDNLSADAEKVAAVNTIINKKGQLSGFNTDTYGITGTLIEAGIDPRGRKCMVVGAGGAGKAAALGLINAGAEVFISNRSAGKAIDFAKKTGCSFTLLHEAENMLKYLDILVLTLPPGIFPFDRKYIHDDLIIIDANYRSSEVASGIKGLPGRIIKGDRWLLHQAVEAYHLFTGKDADTSVMEEGLNEDVVFNKLKIIPIKEMDRGAEYEFYADMLVDSRGLTREQINIIIDEEKNKAFGD